MLKIRIMPVVQIVNASAVKTVSFHGERIVGDAISVVKVFSARNSDELMLIDIGARRNGRPPNFNFISEVARHCFMPLTVGGGVNSLDDAKRIFDSGADRVLLGQLLQSDPDAVCRISSEYGAQSVIAAIDCYWSGTNYMHMTGPKFDMPVEITDLLRRVENVGASEIVVTSINNEGRMVGYDMRLIQEVMSKTSVPVIINGGAGQLNDFALAIDLGVSAVAASSVFMWEGLTISDIKSYLTQSGYSVSVS